MDSALRKDRNFPMPILLLGALSAQRVFRLTEIREWLAEAVMPIAKPKKLMGKTRMFCVLGAVLRNGRRIRPAREKLQEILSAGRGKWIAEALAEVERLQKRSGLFLEVGLASRSA